MTKKFIFALLTASSFAAIAQEEAPAAEMTTSEESALSLNATIGYTSRYVWRGLTFGKESAQADISATYDAGDIGSFNLGLWGTLDLTDEVNDEELNFTEVDIYAGWEKSFDIITLGAGVINYQFPGETGSGNAATTEVYASVALDVILAPSVTVYYDVEEADGDAIYVSTGIGHDFDLGFSTLSVGGAIGWANSDGGDFLYGSGDGFTDVAATVSLNFDLTESLSMSPFVSYTALIEDAKDANGNDNEEIFGGINLSYSF
ncbi:TorF family putative porin [Lentisphaera profundi]|uniref:TorF family putative porin n=1 Tax=Lentisphaera profundi TaxID=1658616 RepID=A0ABY7VUH6_9BACT|nr:TorF family putative porin [Lentisphaera profundi]WDE97863.1 TorF family putative porin [Lentisphaera profundi]